MNISHLAVSECTFNFEKLAFEHNIFLSIFAFLTRCTHSEAPTGVSTVPTLCGVSLLRESSVQVRHEQMHVLCVSLDFFNQK